MRLEKKIEKLEKLLDSLAEKKMVLRPAANYSLDWFRGSFPDRLTIEPSNFHVELCRLADDVFHGRIQRLLVQAPRGSAKSTYISFGLAAYAVAMGEPYILILSDSSAQAAKFLADLRNLFSGLLTKSTTNCLIVGGKVCVEAFGSRAKIRGRRFLSSRPTLIIVDDPQSNSDIISSSERDYSFDWFVREVIPAGSHNCRLIAIGTNIHPECIVSRCERLVDWRTIKYPALLGQFSADDLDYWANRAREVPKQEEANFEKEVREHLRASSFWPARWSVVSLLKIYAEIGRQAFMSEYQQISDYGLGKSLWDSNLVDSCITNLQEFPPSVTELIQSVDPSEGKETGDYQAHCVGGVDEEGNIYVWLDRRRDIDWVNYAVHLSNKFSTSAIVVETNSTMNLALPAIESCIYKYARISGKEHSPQIVGIKHRKPKNVRIQTLSFYLRAGRLRVLLCPGLEEFVNEAKTFPYSKYDDVLDCMSTLVLELEARAAISRGG